MDLNIRHRRALVSASSQGLGKACALALASEGCSVTINGRDERKLEATADEIRQKTKSEVHAVVADINTSKGREDLVAACPAADILINNNQGPPPGNFADWDQKAWYAAIDANMLAPIFLIQMLLPGMRERRFGRIINITSAVVKTPSAMMGLSTSTRAALTALSKGLSREVAVDNVTINSLLPERIDTGRQQFMAQRMMAEGNITLEQARKEITDTIAAKRFGTPQEFGATCAFLCSDHAGFISGQNLQIDGGSYAGLF
jgi:3-oxoacyl-[acyl-carrier protein] reductase